MPTVIRTHLEMITGGCQIGPKLELEGGGGTFSFTQNAKENSMYSMFKRPKYISNTLNGTSTIHT